MNLIPPLNSSSDPWIHPHHPHEAAGLLYIHSGHGFPTELACEEVSCAIFLLVFIVLDFVNGQERVYQERHEVGTSLETQEGAK